ncbi:RNA-guided endonuclease InsQ/TnpB family protein [Kribbella solani]|uniref:RNA-guided endonuclease InsQ/TnpB family protein n=1 Tax=Kribbella solani TaxID=236067 RepID=UPI0029A7C08B|nr:transposase [Kribbella solani]MDX2971907.1 transposase [Kribbella solani]
MSRFRLAPTRDQVPGLLESCRHARYVWNVGLEQRLMWRPGRPAAPGFVAQAAQLTEARAAQLWLKAGSQMVQQQALRDLDQAWRNFYAGTHGRPSWRRKGVHEGFRVVGPQAQRVEKLNRKWGRVLVPKVGWVKFRLSRAVPPAKSYRVTCDRSGRWHIAFAVVPAPIAAPGTGAIVGVDRGVTVSAALSTGELLSCPGLSAREQARLKRLQRRLCRAWRGSNRRARIKAAIARWKARETDRRKNWVEQTSTDLARGFDTIRIENLKIRALTRSARGTIESHGRNVRAKAGLNRGILASGWGQLAARLEHKAPGRVERVRPAYTSQTCSACGHCAPDSRENQAVFRCVACRYEANADVNAAVNIAGGTAAGRAVDTRRETGVSVSEKREPQLATST